MSFFVKSSSNGKGSYQDEDNSSEISKLNKKNFKRHYCHKFDIEKFVCQNGFNLWCIKMRVLLRQQGSVKVLEEKVLDEPFTSTKENEE